MPLDAEPKVRGKALFVADLAPEGCLFGATVRSPHAHALIRGITLDLQYDWGDVAVVTAADVPNDNVIALDDDDQPVLAEKVVRYVGEPVVLVAAPTVAKARDAAAHIQVDYRPLPALLDPRLSEDHPRVIYGDDNVFARIVLSKGSVGVTGGGMTIEGRYEVEAQDHHCLEPTGALAVPRDDGGLTLVGPLMDARATLLSVQRILGHERVNVKQVHIGGSFGRKLEASIPVAAHAALLALKAGAPVRVVLTRAEESQALGKRHALSAHISTRVDMDGRLETFEGTYTFDGGAYCTRSRSMLERAVVHALGPYRCDDVHILGLAVATHRPPSAAFRGGGVAELHFAVERHMDRIAREMSLDPMAARRANLLKHGDKTLTGQVIEHPPGLKVMEAALKKAGSRELSEPGDRPGRPRAASRLMAGRGVSVAVVGGGRPGDDVAERSGEVSLVLRKNRVRLYLPGAESGQGTDTALVQVLAGRLGLEPDRVEFRARDSDRVGVDGPFLGSRGLARGEQAVIRAADALEKALQEHMNSKAPFAELLGQKGAPRKLEVSARFDGEDPVQWDAVHRSGEAYRGFTWHCAVVDVVVDADTGEVGVRRVVTATDAGRVANGKLARGQIEGGVVQALGGALSERIGLDERGAYRAADFRDAGILSTLEAPRQDTLLMRSAEGDPIQGLGEVGFVACGAALAQAVEAATGAVLDALPMAPEHVLQAIP